MSLIELMVGVSVVSIMVMMAMPSLSGWSQNRQIRTTAASIQSGLQLARAEALRRNRDIRFQMLDGSSWQVVCDAVDTTLGDDGQERCPAAPVQTHSAQDGSVNAIITSTQTVATTGAAAASPVFAGNVTFTPLGRVASTSLPAGHLANYRVTNPVGGTCAPTGEMRCLSIVVSAAGQIRMCDPAIAAPDSRAC